MATQTGNKGFTLIELLIVIGIIGFLAAAVLVAVDPVKRIQDSRDARRYSEVNAILNAILTKQVDDRALYNGLAAHTIISSNTEFQVIKSDGATTTTCVSAAPTCPDAAAIVGSGTLNDDTTSSCYADLSTMAPDYIATIPLDPATGTTAHTGYFINRNTANRILIGACDAEQAAAISVRR